MQKHLSSVNNATSVQREDCNINTKLDKLKEAILESSAGYATLEKKDIY
jgi:hypothetical protein